MSDPVVTVGGLSGSDCAALAALLLGLSGRAGAAAGHTPLIAPVLLMGRAELAVAAHAMQPSPGLCALHESQRIERLAPLPMDAPLRLSAAQTDGGFALTITAETGDAPLVRLLTRLRFASPAQIAGLTGATFGDRMAGQGATWAKTRPLDAQSVARYLSLSHDRNPIHRDDQAARAAGLSGVVVPGMMIAGLAESLLDAPATTLATRFMAPVPLGAALEMVAVPRRGGFRVFALLGDRTIAAITDLDTSAAP